MIEFWKDIPDTNGNYQASSCGRIRSRLRGSALARLGKAHPSGWLHTKFCINKGGYYQVQLCISGKQRNFLVHRLVALAFLGNPNQLEQVNHKDFNRKNNQVSNLEWTSRRENIDHALLAGRYDIKNPPKGISHWNSRLTEEIIGDIRTKRMKGKEFAKIYGISDSTVSQIQHGKRWKHIA